MDRPVANMENDLQIETTVVQAIAEAGTSHCDGFNLFKPSPSEHMVPA